MESLNDNLLENELTGLVLNCPQDSSRNFKIGYQIGKGASRHVFQVIDSANLEKKFVVKFSKISLKNEVKTIKKV
jgi:glycerol-3-phosphate dehydrogenase